MAARLALIILMGAAALLAGCRTVPPSATESVPQAHVAGLDRRDAVMAEALANYGMGVLREGARDPAGAVSNFLQAVKLEPDIPALYLRVAVQHIRRGDNAKAIAIMEEACRHNPKSLSSVLLLSQIYQLANRPEEARKVAQRAIALEPKNSKSYVQLAALYVAGKDKQSAQKVLKRALAAGVQDRLPILRMLGDLYVQQIHAFSVPSPDLKEAIALYEQAVTFPTDELSLIYLQKLGDLYLINRQVDKALGCFQQIAIHEPDNVQTQQKLALCYVAMGDREKALAAIKNISGREPQSPDIYYYLGELYDSLGDEEHAIENFRAARDAEPSNPKSYLKMAVIHLRDNPQKAKEILQEGLKRMPKERLFLEILVQIYLRNHQFREALALFEQMQSSLAPDDVILKDPRFYVHYGVAAQQCGLDAQAAGLYRRALEMDPGLLEARTCLAMLYVAVDFPGEALALMEEAVYAKPDDAATWYFYALINNRVERYQQAAEAFGIIEQLVKNLPDRGAAALDSSFYFNYGAACERSGGYDRAEKLLTKAIALDPENSDALNYLAYMWAEKDLHLVQALEYINQALDIEPENGAYLDTLGWVLFKQGKYENALEEIQDAHELMPEDPTIMEHLGDVLAKMGREDQALEAWKQSFIANSANQALQQKLRARGVDVEKLLKHHKRK